MPNLQPHTSQQGQSHHDAGAARAFPHFLEALLQGDKAFENRMALLDQDDLPPEVILHYLTLDDLKRLQETEKEASRHSWAMASASLQASMRSLKSVGMFSVSEVFCNLIGAMSEDQMNASLAEREAKKEAEAEEVSKAAEAANREADLWAKRRNRLEALLDWQPQKTPEAVAA